MVSVHVYMESLCGYIMCVYMYVSVGPTSVIFLFILFFLLFIAQLFTLCFIIFFNFFII